ncbi:hypothetical protein SU48_10430 [Deinococcus puniceus]|uniref:Uncharacterized protein n=2 Tax=Deinococcus puniceus TaxID=1182568 RepID=A0A172TAS8_9DEIO|nr:hypothetical protein SU48_10430 [Deinococcus puniceus]
MMAGAVRADALPSDLHRVYSQQATLTRNFGYSAMMTPQVFYLAAGQQIERQVDVVSGETMVQAICNSECSDLNLEVMDASGWVLVSDMAENAVPVASWWGDAGSYRVRITMKTCAAPTCTAALLGFN